MSCSMNSRKESREFLDMGSSLTFHANYAKNHLTAFVLGSGFHKAHPSPTPIQPQLKIQFGDQHGDVGQPIRSPHGLARLAALSGMVLLR